MKIFNAREKIYIAANILFSLFLIISIWLGDIISLHIALTLLIIDFSGNEILKKLERKNKELLNETKERQNETKN